MGKRLTQIKFKQIAYVMHEMKETKGCLKKKNGSRRPRLPASFHAVASQQTFRGQDASTASTDATARPEEDENQDIEAVNSGMRLLRFGGRYK